MPFQICLFVCCFPLHSSFERALKLGHYETERDGGRESSVCCFLVPHAFYTSSNRNAPPSSYVLAHKGRAVYDMHHTFIDISTYVCVAHVHTDASVFVASQKRRAARERGQRQFAGSAYLSLGSSGSSVVFSVCHQGAGQKKLRTHLWC